MNEIEKVLFRSAGNSSILQPVAIDAIKGIIDGRPIVFNQRTNIANFFYEEIAPDALRDADLSDIPLFLNHNDNMLPLARHRRGRRSTMEVEVDNEGLRINATLDIDNNTDARRLCSAIQRGDIEGMSFAFRMEVEGDEWFDILADMPIRRITKIRKVFEVSAVNDPAYPQTHITARSAATLDNEKKALAIARALALDNEKSVRNKSLFLEKEKFKFLLEVKSK